MSLLESLKTLNISKDAVTALRVKSTTDDNNIPMHTHEKGQLIFTLRGGVTSIAPDTYWFIPLNHAVWIPAEVPHSNKVTHDAEVFLLYIDSTLINMPPTPCTLKLTPMLREMIKHYETISNKKYNSDYTSKFIDVMLHELANIQRESFSLPISENPKIRLLADYIMTNPTSRLTIELWAKNMAMSKRTFERFILKETGISFGRWRQKLQLLIAIRLLNSGVTVQNVAYELGYDSVTSFIIMFKKNIGKTPGHYINDKLDHVNT